MMEILPFQLMARRISLCGSNIGSPKETKEMFEVASKFNIKAQIEVFPLSEANKALKRVKENQVRYRCVLDCSKTTSKL